MNETQPTLSAHEQHRGFSTWICFIRINAVSNVCIADSLMILYLLKLGFTPSQTALMSLFCLFATAFVLLGRRLIAVWGLAKTHGLCWLFSNFLILNICLFPLLSGIISHSTVKTEVMFSFFVFFCFRAIGGMVSSPLIGELMSEYNCGRLLSINTLNTTGFVFLANLGVIFILGLYDNLVATRSIIAGGALLGLASVAVVWRVPETRVPKESARQPFWPALKELLHDRKWLRLLFVCGASSAMAPLIGAFGIIALSKGYALAPRTIILLGLMTVLGGMFCAWMRRFLSSPASERRMFLIHGTGCILVCLGWVFAPQKFHYWYSGGQLLVYGFCATGIALTLSHYFQASTTSANRVTVGMLFSTSNGIIAGLVGSLIGSRLLENTLAYHPHGLTGYRWYFGLVIIVELALLYIARGIHISRS